MGAIALINGIDQGIELKGGSQANIELTKTISSIELEHELESALGGVEVQVKSKNGNRATVEIGPGIDQAKFESVLKGSGKVTGYNAVSPVLSTEAMEQIYWAIGFAFIFMSITVFIIFREPIPSIAVILAAVSDIVIAVGGMSLFNINLSIASVGAILMLIGYSVDSDILLTTRVLRRKEGTVTERATGAMKTGLTMSAAAIGSMLVLYIVTVIYIPEATTLKDIAAVLIIGLLGDLIATWLMNLGIIRWYIDRRQTR
jgi:preprotein translocase subunit SecF